MEAIDKIKSAESYLHRIGLLRYATLMAALLVTAFAWHVFEQRDVYFPVIIKAAAGNPAYIGFGVLSACFVAAVVYVGRMMVGLRRELHALRDQVTKLSLQLVHEGIVPVTGPGEFIQPKRPKHVLR